VWPRVAPGKAPRLEEGQSRLRDGVVFRKTPLHHGEATDRFGCRAG
jgi:hypothetical protein